jgi:maltose O-acetyltransferase
MNTTIGNDVIIGAGSLVTGNIPDDSIVAGVPARVIGKTSEYIAREKEKMQNSLVFDNTYTYQKNITKAKKDEMLSRFEDKPGVGYLDIGFYED